MIVIGLDHGNGHVKGKSDLKTIQAMSAVARPGAFGTGIAGEKSKTHKVKEYTVNDFNNETYLWGEEIWKAPTVNHSFTTENRYEQKIYQTLTKIALAELANNGEKAIECIVVTGCPTQEANTSVVRTLEELIIGDHVVSIEGSKVLLDIREVRVLPQPIGTIMDLYIDEDGSVEDESYETDYIGIIDIGSGTTDLDGIKELNRQDEDMQTINIGMNRAYKNIAKWIKAEKPAEASGVTWQTVEFQIRNNIDPSQFFISKRVSIDIGRMMQDEFRKLADDIITNISQAWPSRSKFDKLILTGGGAEIAILAKEFIKWDKDITVVKDAQMSNARGFWKYGKAFLLEDHIN